MHSPSHKKGILLKSARSIGIGCATTHGYDEYWTLEFSSTKAKKTEKRTGKVSSKKKVTMRSSLMKKKYFRIHPQGDYSYSDYSGKNVEMEVGAKAVMNPYYSGGQMVPGGSTLLDRSIMTWKSSNPSVLSIDSKGNMVALSSGPPVTITGTMKKAPKFKITKTITVLEYSDDDDWDYDDDYDYDYDYDYEDDGDYDYD